jgi:hypothetical protein
MPNSTNRKRVNGLTNRGAVPLNTAMRSSDLIANLREKIAASTERLHAILHLIPPENRKLVAAGPYDERGWCIVVATPAMASKLRQILPSLTTQLKESGLPTSTVRIHITRI